MSDRELLAKFVAMRDEAAFAELVRRHGGMVRAAASRLAPRDADDVAQAVFMLLAQRARRLRSHQSLGGWLYRTARLCARNARRREARRIKHIERAGEQKMPNYDENESAEHRELIDAALARLNEAQRQVIILRYLEDLSLEQTAERLAIRPDAVAKRAQRGLEKMRAVMASRGADPAVGSLAGLLAAQQLSLTEAQVGAMTQACHGASTVGASSLALATGATLMYAHIKVVAVVILVGRRDDTATPIVAPAAPGR